MGPWGSLLLGGGGGEIGRPRCGGYGGWSEDDGCANSAFGQAVGSGSEVYSRRASVISEIRATEMKARRGRPGLAAQLSARRPCPRSAAGICMLEVRDVRHLSQGGVEV